jgi:phosphoribosylformylglycinamidine (FGAM) synthase-like amidotransferase family enzyme
MKFGVLVFPGSNCDHDTYHVVEALAKQPVTFLWHASEDLEGCDAILVPGGFAYGDYLRTGAIAKFAPVMQSVAKFAKNGGLVLGICCAMQVSTIFASRLTYVPRRSLLRLRTDCRRVRYCKCRSVIWKAITFAMQTRWLR